MSKKMKKDALGDLMKAYEALETERKFMPGAYTMARLDGRAFHTFTRGLERPYSTRFSRCMAETAAALVQDFHADLAYTQSDEITLVWVPRAQEEMIFGGRIFKLKSLLASRASIAFLRAVAREIPEKAHLNPIFDCRAFAMPNEAAAFQAFQWREIDATRNSLIMLTQAHYSQKEMHKKGVADQHNMLHAKGINWNDEPAFFKRGTYLRRTSYLKELTGAELTRIPLHKRPEGPVVRSAVFPLAVPPIYQIDALDWIINAPDPDLTHPWFPNEALRESLRACA
ncbi:tRNA-His guanylyltransferase [Burkholderia phage BcepSaruman]|uniref:tRNA-His guanylyltransferase n=1 Tax=Burkholderia phage BcepSaruman TaxID=2530032 RepID=A0A4D5ZCH4_9CAUD|nr:tRNA-His guanylyltransferase [Burkholderia phage BcepSaruman]QBX06745.1 tRNA-His guanylyltransferase [Burkholderia phage BcepSaruman]